MRGISANVHGCDNSAEAHGPQRLGFCERVKQTVSAIQEKMYLQAILTEPVRQALRT